MFSIPKNILLLLLGIVFATACTSLAGVFFFILLHFNWWHWIVVGPITGLTIYTGFISYAMFKVALIGEENAVTDE